MKPRGYKSAMLAMLIITVITISCAWNSEMQHRKVVAAYEAALNIASAVDHK